MTNKDYRLYRCVVAVCAVTFVSSLVFGSIANAVVSLAGVVIGLHMLLRKESERQDEVIPSVPDNHSNENINRFCARKEVVERAMILGLGFFSGYTSTVKSDGGAYAELMKVLGLISIALAGGLLVKASCTRGADEVCHEEKPPEQEEDTGEPNP